MATKTETIKDLSEEYVVLTMKKSEYERYEIYADMPNGRHMHIGWVVPRDKDWNAYLANPDPYKYDGTLITIEATRRQATRMLGLEFIILHDTGRWGETSC